MVKKSVLKVVARISSLVSRFQPARHASRTTLHVFEERCANKAAIEGQIEWIADPSPRLHGDRLVSTTPPAVSSVMDHLVSHRSGSRYRPWRRTTNRSSH